MPTFVGIYLATDVFKPIHGDQTMERQIRAFVPWRDDALLEGESLYALWNKFAWFVGISPAALVRGCRLPRVGLAAPKWIHYRHADWARYLESPEKLPTIQGISTAEAVKAYAAAMDLEVPEKWRSQRLRVCEHCISMGIHLRIHQHLVVERCPLHNVPLRSTCGACGHALDFHSEQHRAFSCVRCGHCFLDKGLVKVAIPLSLRKKAATVIESVLAWLRPINSDLQLKQNGCQGGGWANEDNPLSHLRVRALFIDGFRRSSRSVPVWMQNPICGKAAVSITRIDPLATSLSGAMRQGIDVEHWVTKVCDSADQPDEDYDEVPVEAPDIELEDRYLQALRRVAAKFMLSIQGRHRECLDAAPLVARLAGGDEHDLTPAMLRCCPVALGFWLWRRRGSAFSLWMSAFSDCYFERDGKTHVGAGTDLLFYALARSDLHACIMVAMECVKHQEDSGDDLAALEMLSIWEGWRLSSYSISRQSLDFDAENSGWTFLRIDASHLMATTRCPGLEPYQNVVRQRLRSVPVFNRKTGQIEQWNMEDTWQERALDYLSHKNPRIELKSWGRDCTPRAFFAMLNIVPKGSHSFRCVDSAIDSRAKAAELFRQSRGAGVGSIARARSAGDG
ncbi:hypothetical protein [Dyella sp. Tek66A03]|uniref:hypothetical protein n=1 Tax=Dyella sp. Tek66A03 TaxID=3458298 RepID=UPI00403EDA41